MIANFAVGIKVQAVDELRVEYGNSEWERFCSWSNDKTRHKYNQLFSIPTESDRIGHPVLTVEERMRGNTRRSEIVLKQTFSLPIVLSGLG